MVCDIPFILAFSEKMEIPPGKQGIIFKFGKTYTVEKMTAIYDLATSYYWWRDQPIAAFLKALKTINKEGFESVGEILPRVLEEKENLWKK